MRPIIRANDALTFVLELATYTAVVIWAINTSTGAAAEAALVIAGVVIMAFAWALFAAPKASMRRHGISLVAFEVVWLGLGVAAIAAAGHLGLAATLAATDALNGILRAVLASRPIPAHPHPNSL